MSPYEGVREPLGWPYLGEPTWDQAIPPPIGIAAMRTQYRLTERQAQVAILLYWRRTDAEIASALGIRRKTVESHVAAVLLRLGIRSRREAEAILAQRPISR